MNRISNAWGRLSYTGHVALFSSCSPLIFFHADKTTELAAAIIPVTILHSLHTDSTYHSPLRETFVQDIREDFSNLVHCNLVWIYPIVWCQTKTKYRFPDFQDNVNVITWLLGFGNVCIDGIGRKKKLLKSALNKNLWHRRVSQENETRNYKKTLHWSFSLLASGDK